jgi:hypothetical protein
MPFDVSTTTSYARRIALVWLFFPHFRSALLLCGCFAYGAPGDSQYDYIRMAESTAMECMSTFCRAVVSVFGSDYLRTPNEEDTACILGQNAERGFPGMLVASIACIGNGRTVCLLGRICTNVTKEVAVWY